MISIGRGHFLTGDCLELMKMIRDNSVDMIFTDPAYRTISGGTNSTLAAGWNGSVLHKNDGKIFEHNDISSGDYLKEFYRILKPGSHCYVMTNNINLRLLLNNAETTGFGFHNLLVWRKNNCTANRWYMKEMELVCFFYKKPAKPINNMSSKQIIEIHNPRNKKHPTEKPVELMEHYIQNSSEEGNIILDPFGGSGATAIACENTNRNWICMEKDETYANAAIERIRKHVENNNAKGLPDESLRIDI